MNKFTTFNQFDSRFKLNNFGSNCNACPVFGLFTAYNFMKNGDTSKEQHEKNLESAVMNYIMNEYTKELPKYLSIEELTKFMGDSYYPNNVQGTTPEMINSEELGYNLIFDTTSKENYCVIFLKNANFICVLIDNSENIPKICVRDCHENDHYSYNCYEDLYDHLNQKYQFNKLTIVDDVMIAEFSNIEYLQITKPFEVIVLDPDLYNEELLYHNSQTNALNTNALNTNVPMNNILNTNVPMNNLNGTTLYDELLAIQTQYDDYDQNIENYY